jgi:hypothetical protein
MQKPRTIRTISNILLAFEDAFAASAEWVPYLLASSVHALHGPQSEDSPVLLQAREALA